MRKELCKF